MLRHLPTYLHQFWSPANLNFLDIQTVKLIVNALGFVPLALEQAGAFINDTQTTLGKYLQLIETRRGDLLASGSVKRFGNQASVFATWELSLKRLDSDATELLTTLAFLHHASFCEELFTAPDERPAIDGLALDRVAKRGPSRFRDFHHTPVAQPVVDGLSFEWADQILNDEIRLMVALGKILAVSLAKRNSEDQTIYLHPLVHSWGRDRLSPDLRTKKLAQALLVVGKAVETQEKIRSSSASPMAMTRAGRVMVQQHYEHCLALMEEEDNSGEIYALMLTCPAAAHALYNMAKSCEKSNRHLQSVAIYDAILAAQEKWHAACLCASESHLAPSDNNLRGPLSTCIIRSVAIRRQHALFTSPWGSFVPKSPLLLQDINHTPELTGALNRTAHSTFWMVETLRQVLELDYEDILDDPTCLGEFDGEWVQEQANESPNFDWSPNMDRIGSAIPHKYADTFQFQYHDVEGRRIARCEKTGIVIDCNTRAVTNTSRNGTGKASTATHKINNGDSWMEDTYTLSIANVLQIGLVETAHKLPMYCLFRYVP